LKKPSLSDYSLAVCFGDRHALSNDTRIDSILFQIIEDHTDQIKYIIDLGDGVDADCLSSYDKSLNQIAGLQKELDNDYNFRQQINERSPESIKILLESNHFSSRLSKAKSRELWLSDLTAMSESNLLKLEELGWELRTEFIWGKKKLMFIHGDTNSIGSQKNIINKARDLTKENNISTILGHSHCTGAEVSRKLGQYYYSIQLGTLYDLRKAPSYIKSGQYLSNWTNSFGVFYLRRDGRQFFYVPVVIEDGVTIFNNKLYQG
jgi:predicted phosphodiesterase